MCAHPSWLLSVSRSLLLMTCVRFLNRFITFLRIQKILPHCLCKPPPCQTSSFRASVPDIIHKNMTQYDATKRQKQTCETNQNLFVGSLSWDICSDKCLSSELFKPLPTLYNAASSSFVYYIMLDFITFKALFKEQRLFLNPRSLKGNTTQF